MFLSVIPLESSIDDSGLTYFAKDSHKKNLHIGSLVSVPIKESIHFGIVSEILPSDFQPMTEIRSIVNITCSAPLLSAYQCRLIHSLAKKYFVHAHKVLALFLPKFVFNALEKKAFEPMIDTENIKHSALKKNHSCLFFYNTKYINLSEFIQKFIQQHSHKIAIIFPDDLLISQTLNHLENIKKNATIVKNSDTYTRRYKTWLEISKKKNPICIGTRRLLQYNLAGYEHILYIEDALSRFTHSYEHIYKNTDILESLTENGFDITIFSSIPTIESMYKIKQGKYILL